MKNITAGVNEKKDDIVWFFLKTKKSFKIVYLFIIVEYTFKIIKYPVRYYPCNIFTCTYVCMYAFCIKKRERKR